MSTPGPIRYVLLADIDAMDGDTVPVFLSTFINEHTWVKADRWQATAVRDKAMLFHNEWTARFFYSHWLTADAQATFRVATVRLPVKGRA
jgi:hypothetical protein